MQGFDNKALILFPYIENYDSKTYEYKSQFRLALGKLCKYLKEIGVEPHVFYSDDLAREVCLEDFVWVSTLSRADSFFASKNCDGMSEALTRPTVHFDEIYNSITEKDPGDLKMSVEERFELICRHSTKAISKIIPKYKIVIHFNFKSKMQYKVTSKVGDNKIRIYIDANTFMPDTYIGGMHADPTDLLARNYANRSLVDWEI